MIERVITAVENFKQHYKIYKKVKPFDFTFLNILNENTLQYTIGYLYKSKITFKKLITKGGGLFKKSEVDPLISKMEEILNNILYFEKSINENLQIINKKKGDIISIYGNKTQLDKNYEKKIYTLKREMLLILHNIKNAQNSILVLIKKHLIVLIALNHTINKKKYGPNYVEMFYLDIINLLNVFNNTISNGESILYDLELRYLQSTVFNKYNKSVKLDFPKVPTYKLSTHKNIEGKKK